MSPLQIGLLAAGAVVIVLVVAYNLWTERRARRRAEQAFAGNAGDALFEMPNARREPTMGELSSMPVGDLSEISARLAFLGVVTANVKWFLLELDVLLGQIEVAAKRRR